jgi:hypothetical protein
VEESFGLVCRVVELRGRGFRGRGEERRGEELVFLAQRPFFFFGCGLRRSGGWVILIEVLTCLVAVVDCLSVWLSVWLSAWWKRK